MSRWSPGQLRACFEVKALCSPHGEDVRAVSSWAASMTAEDGHAVFFITDQWTNIGITWSV